MGPTMTLTFIHRDYTFIYVPTLHSFPTDKTSIQVNKLIVLPIRQIRKSLLP